MMNPIVRIGCLLLLAFLAAAPARADVTLHALFSDNVVLQRDAIVPVWGWAKPGEQVTVKLDRQVRTTTTGVDGAWMVKLSPMKAGGPYDMTVTGENTLTVKNVLFGEVWLAGGQSNMTVSVNDTTDWQKESAAADYPDVRMFTVPMVVATFPLQNVKGSWVIVTPQTAPVMSATAFYFARELYKRLHVPVGIVTSAAGATMAEAWTRLEAMNGIPELEPILQRADDDVVKYQQDWTTYQDKLAAWNVAEQAAAADNKPAAKKPVPPADPTTEFFDHPAGLYNGQIAPLIPYQIKGVIWWQGEFNSERCQQYKILFPALIRDWRRAWRQDDLPFIFVQLENLDIEPQPNLAHYDEMREAQLYTYQTVPNTGIVTAVDIGDAHNVHMPNKAPLGLRLANMAANMVYGMKDIVCLGPIYKASSLEGDKIRIAFTHTDGGLVAHNGDKLGSFTIAAADRKFVPAEAKIDGDAVVVWSTEVKTPVAVRYAWADNPTCTLFNQAGLPAFPFRTDDWPTPTTGKF